MHNTVKTNYFLEIILILIKKETVVKSLANSQYKINYKNLLFKSGDIDVKNVDFLKNFGTLYDLLKSLLNENMTNDEVEQGQYVTTKKIIELMHLKKFALSEIK